MGRREASAGPRQSFLHSFLTLTVLRAGLEATRLHLPALRQLVRGYDRMQFGQFSLQSFVLPQASYPRHSLPDSRNIISAGCNPSRPAAVQGPLISPPSSPPHTLQVLPVFPIIHDALTSVRVLWENRWLPQIREIPGGLLTKGDCLPKGQGRGGKGTRGRV